MGPMKLYKILQQHVGTVNEMVAMLYHEKITADEARVKARDEIQKTLAAIDEKD
jgi:hypothetical protein